MSISWNDLIENDEEGRRVLVATIRHTLPAHMRGFVEDVLQETLLALVSKAETQFDSSYGTIAFVLRSAWARTIAVNKAIDFVRRERRSWRRTEDIGDIDDARVTVYPIPSAMERAEEEKASQELEAALLSFTAWPGRFERPKQSALRLGLGRLMIENGPERPQRFWQRLLPGHTEAAIRMALSHERRLIMAFAIWWKDRSSPVLDTLGREGRMIRLFIESWPDSAGWGELRNVHADPPSESSL
jgi:hypothetical protein